MLFCLIGSTAPELPPECIAHSFQLSRSLLDQVSQHFYFFYFILLITLQYLFKTSYVCGPMIGRRAIEQRDRAYYSYYFFNPGSRDIVGPIVLFWVIKKPFWLKLVLLKEKKFLPLKVPAG